MARSIDDFYSDAARGRDAFRFDHENDDPAELAADFWDLVTHRAGGDGRPPVTRRAAAVTRRPAPAPKAAAPARSMATTPARRGPVSHADLLLALQVLRAFAPGLTKESMCRYLRKCDWPGIDAATVGRTLSGLPGRTSARTTEANLALAVRVARAAMPWMSATTIAGNLHRLGWTSVTGKDIDAVLATGGRAPKPTAAAGRRTSVKSPPRRRQPAGRAGGRSEEVDTLRDDELIAFQRLERRDRQPRSAGCPSCGVVPSALGTCRCS
ncbi:hypothetical protein OHA21_24455 [Actinoplanes sp. NBC_00393]|uniref:hypothetical protein n=1 Tax=Actinoplanes sp. NBC_00393 TaxID=2975953 RepID=UPI002E1AD8A6